MRNMRTRAQLQLPRGRISPNTSKRSARMILTPPRPAVQPVSLFPRSVLQAEPSQIPDPRHVWSRHSLPITDLCCGFGGPLARAATASLDQTAKVRLGSSPAEPWRGAGFPPRLCRAAAERSGLQQLNVLAGSVMTQSSCLSKQQQFLCTCPRAGPPQSLCSQECQGQLRFPSPTRAEQPRAPVCSFCSAGRVYPGGRMGSGGG